MIALGLKIGAGTAIISVIENFSVIENVLLDPWPHRDPGRIATVQIHDNQSRGEGGRNGCFTQEFVEYVRNTTFPPCLRVGTSRVTTTCSSPTTSFSTVSPTWPKQTPISALGVRPDCTIGITDAFRRLAISKFVRTIRKSGG